MSATAFTIHAKMKTTSLAFKPDALIIAGWAGRDAEAVEAHIRELEEIGVARPTSTPTFYRLSPMLLTTAPRIAVAGNEATGEAEVVLIRTDGQCYVGIGSDLTDRKLETVSVTLSKQVCAKPVGGDLWPLEEVEGHWDQLTLSSSIEVDGEWVSYQKGALQSLLSPRDLLSRLEQQRIGFDDGAAMLCGTVPTIGAIRFAHRMQMQLGDPVLGRSITHEIALDPLELAD